MKLRRKLAAVLSFTLAGCLSIGGIVLAEEASVPAETAPAAVEAAPEETQAMSVKTLGQEEEGALQITITNNTGKEIGYISVDKYVSDPMAHNLVYRMQEALIEGGYLDDVADGSAGPKTQAAIAAFRTANGLSEDGGADEEMLEKLMGPGYDGNLLGKDDVFAAGETRVLYIPVKDEAQEAEAPAGADPVVQALEAFQMAPDYVAVFREAGQEKEYFLFVFPASVMATAQLNIKDDVPYIEYTLEGSAETVSTYDAEAATYNAVFAPAPVVEEQYDYGYDYGYEESYDYGYDPGYYEEPAYVEPAYEEPAYVEPAYEAPYIVIEEVYPSCDDGSHGVIYRVWSDGTEERIDF